jgi:hypothetical protein
MFHITHGSGFQMTFENRVTLSVQFGPGNYCDCENRSTYDLNAPRNTGHWKSKNAEVAILLPNGDFYQIQEHDKVEGWQTVEDVCKWIEVAKNLSVTA